MGATPSARLAAAAGVVSLASFSAALIALPAAPTTGAGFSPPALTTSVNRALKGDRLPAAAGPGRLGSPARVLPGARIPFGCEAAFSPISSPALAHIIRRCMV
jgi:hypothetical protein